MLGERPAQRGLSRYFGSSVKGEANIDWDDESARRAFLKEVVADADRLLQMARQALESSVDDVARERLTEAAELLAQLLLQDIERRPDGVGARSRDASWPQEQVPAVRWA